MLAAHKFSLKIGQCKRSVVCRGLKENIAKLPSTAGIKSVRVIQLCNSNIRALIEPMPGKMASVAIYNHLATKYNGQLGVDAAAEGLELYSQEIVDDAVARPGAHPSIELLLEVQKSDGMVLKVEVTR